MREVLETFSGVSEHLFCYCLTLLRWGVASFLALWVQSEFVFSDIGTDVLRSVYGGICRSML